MADPQNALRPGPPSNIPGVMDRVAQQYPALSQHLNKFAVQWGDPAQNPGGGHLEFFPPWESYNPNPGRPTIEMYDPRLQGNALVSAIGGDALHYIGSKNPQTGQSVDPQWGAMKNALIGSLTPQQLSVDQRAYAQAQQQGDRRSFDDWMQDSRADAYIRGHITPDANDEWRKQGVYTPPQNALLGAMRQYLSSPPVSPQNMPPSNALGQIATRGIWDQQ